MIKAIVNIYLKDGVSDPKAKAVHNELETLKFNEVIDVRIGKQLIFELNETDKIKAEIRVKEMCETILANPVIEDYNIEIVQ